LTGRQPARAVQAIRDLTRRVAHAYATQALLGIGVGVLFVVVFATIIGPVLVSLEQSDAGLSFLARVEDWGIAPSAKDAPRVQAWREERAKLKPSKLTPAEERELAALEARAAHCPPTP
jgi:hypothetical protein